MTMNKNILKDHNVFTTYDLGVAAALLTSGYKLLDVDRTNRKALFMFVTTETGTPEPRRPGLRSL